VKPKHGATRGNTSKDQQKKLPLGGGVACCAVLDSLFSGVSQHGATTSKHQKTRASWVGTSSTMRCIHQEHAVLPKYNASQPVGLPHGGLTFFFSMYIDAPRRNKIGRDRKATHTHIFFKKNNNKIIKKNHKIERFYGRKK
jgi:hypothetical protein